MSYIPLHLYEEDVAEQVTEIVETLKSISALDKLKEAFAKAIDKHVEEIVAEHMNSVEIMTCCSGEGSVFAYYADRSDLADKKRFLRASISFAEFLDDLDPSGCDSRKSQERFARMFEAVAARFRDDTFFKERGSVDGAGVSEPDHQGNS